MCSYRKTILIFQNSNSSDPTQGSTTQLVKSSGPSKNYQAFDENTPEDTGNGMSAASTIPDEEKELSFFNKMYLFYFKTPAVKFYLNLVISIFASILYCQYTE